MAAQAAGNSVGPIVRQSAQSATRQGECNLAKPNFGYQKRQKELEKKRKKEEKMKKKLERNAAPAAEEAPAPAPDGPEQG